MLFEPGCLTAPGPDIYYPAQVLLDWGGGLALCSGYNPGHCCGSHETGRVTDSDKRSRNYDRTK